ncbi:AzlC family ABC transporter permease [Bordetella genomosp. 5]|uniref:Azaleucine resistance protein AzlC n=1 Tax=Bordetella genomosp. 5 TaxID=1395608 RepID=A0A261T7T2_9BORD|nr:AzlC family ABC transporter permease [Bordetella genomosp. 5]OZI45674.1 azaleucine resistance protein AzlC [Bordetella genomosp. 5]
MNSDSSGAPLPVAAGRPVLAGIKACVPVMIGYFPVAVAFGIAGVGTGLAPYQVVLISVLVYAGASQFLLLASIKAGTPWPWVVALCSLLNARHLLYGPLLSRWLPPALSTRLRLAFFLTDEVFATALHKLDAVDTRARARWMAGLGVAAWLTWIAGTAVGVYAGEGLERQFPMLAQVMRFALPALFVALVCQSARRELWLPLGAALGVGAVLAGAGYGTLAILAGALAGCLCFRPARGVQ